MCSFTGLYYLNSLVSFEHNLGVCLQNYPVIGRRNKNLYVCREFTFLPQSRIYQKGGKKALPVCLPLKKTAVPISKVMWPFEWPWDFSIPMYYLKMWRRQNAMFKTTAKCFQSTGGFLWVRSKEWVQVFLLVFCYHVKIAQAWCSTRKDLELDRFGAGPL